MEKSCRQSDSLVNPRICFIPFSTQPRHLGLKAWHRQKNGEFVCEMMNSSMKDELHSYLKLRPLIFPSILRHFYAARVEEVKSRIHTWSP